MLLEWNGDENLYYFDPSGYMATGWRELKTSEGMKWHYFSGGGTLVLGWQLIDGKWYYFYDEGGALYGVMASDTYIDEYYVNEDGVWEE